MRFTHHFHEVNARRKAQDLSCQNLALPVQEMHGNVIAWKVLSINLGRGKARISCSCTLPRKSVGLTGRVSPSVEPRLMHENALWKNVASAACCCWLSARTSFVARHLQARIFCCGIAKLSENVVVQVVCAPSEKLCCYRYPRRTPSATCRAFAF